MMFLQNLHAATGGTSDDLLAFITPLMKRTPFPQMAELADAAPTISASGKIVDSDDPPLQAPFGSLRFELARASRDGTAAERWHWLVQRNEDRAAGTSLEKLVTSWCLNDYFDTAAWVRTLPAGAERDSAAKGIMGFFHQTYIRRMLHPPAGEAADALMKEWKQK